jgi:hypothetical protein
MAPPTAADVDAAAAKLAGTALRTPLVTSPVLDALVGAVFLKAETLQRTGGRPPVRTSTASADRRRQSVARADCCRHQC